MRLFLIVYLSRASESFSGIVFRGDNQVCFGVSCDGVGLLSAAGVASLQGMGLWTREEASSLGWHDLLRSGIGSQVLASNQAVGRCCLRRDDADLRAISNQTLAPPRHDMACRRCSRILFICHLVLVILSGIHTDVLALLKRLLFDYKLMIKLCFKIVRINLVV